MHSWGPSSRPGTEPTPPPLSEWDPLVIPCLPPRGNESRHRSQVTFCSTQSTLSSRLVQHCAGSGAHGPRIATLAPELHDRVVARTGARQQRGDHLSPGRLARALRASDQKTTRESSTPPPARLRRIPAPLGRPERTITT
jgi:hypothetical protein